MNSQVVITPMETSKDRRKLPIPPILQVISHLKKAGSYFFFNIIFTSHAVGMNHPCTPFSLFKFLENDFPKFSNPDSVGVKWKNLIIFVSIFDTKLFQLFLSDFSYLRSLFIFVSSKCLFFSYIFLNFVFSCWRL